MTRRSSSGHIFFFRTGRAASWGTRAPPRDRLCLTSAPSQEVAHASARLESRKWRIVNEELHWTVVGRRGPASTPTSSHLTRDADVERRSSPRHERERLVCDLYPKLVEALKDVEFVVSEAKGGLQTAAMFTEVVFNGKLSACGAPKVAEILRYGWKDWFSEGFIWPEEWTRRDSDDEEDYGPLPILPFTWENHIMQIIDGTADELKLLLSLVRNDGTGKTSFCRATLLLLPLVRRLDPGPSAGHAQAVVRRLPGGGPAEAPRVEGQGRGVGGARVFLHPAGTWALCLAAPPAPPLRTLGAPDHLLRGRGRHDARGARPRPAAL
jgi:hypothetical protein